ncbi:MAG: translation initiation factor IF-2 [Bacteroidales bacterium]|nr:translation initiation factor IF-2 [Bacteroidales bacterium]
MGIRISKAAKEFNVSHATIVEYLNSNGHEVDNSPNVKLTEEQYNAVSQAFGKDKATRDQADKLFHDRAQEKREEKKEKKEKKEGQKREKQTAVATPVETTEVLPTPQPEQPTAPQVTEPEVFRLDSEKTEGPQLKPVGHINLDAKGNPIPEKSTKEVPATEQPQPQVADSLDVQLPEQPETPQEATAAEVSNEPFRLHPAPEVAGPKVLGKIDLAAINAKTHPARKTKEEKRKERAQSGDKKKRQRIGSEAVDINAVAQQNSGAKAGAQGRNQQANQQNTGKRKDNKKRNNTPVNTAPVSEEDIAKQVKETLARLTQKGKPQKGAKYRKEKRESARAQMDEQLREQSADSKVLKLTEFVTANELASMMDVPVTQVIGTCMTIGVMVSINQRLDAETINIVAEEFGFTTEYVSAEVSDAVIEEPDAEEDLQPRAPIITVMGHVDHGKTSLLDYIRKANVIAGEAGGITQHIGAYNVTLDDGRRITFLDTPGHEAFTAMRARGAQATDIAIIIIAADDDIMPQTKEAINHAQAAGVPIVFAINKVDKPAANPDKIKEGLANLNFLVEEWGGKYQSQDISAKQGLGVKELLEKVLLEAEMLELRANPNRKATGTIVESSLDKGRGYVANILVSNGTLRQGDVVLAGTHFGRVKALSNERNQRIQEVGPSEAAVLLGFNGAPQAGDTFHVMESEQAARELANKREQLQREQGLRTQKMLTLDEVGRRIALGNFQELNVIVKGDVDGSVEALSDSLIRLSTEKIAVNVINKSVGQISENDVTLAATSGAIIIGFQVRPSLPARRLAEQHGVDIRMYSIIYDAIEEVRDAMEGMLAPVLKEEQTATIEVRQVYNITKVGLVAGAYVIDGKVKRSDKARLIRDGIVIFTGEINALKRFKDDVKEVATNFECGISLHGCNDMQEGDIIETFTEIEVKQKL